MNVIDHLASIPYRILGILLMFIMILVSIPIALGGILTVLASGRDIREVGSVGRMMVEGLTLREMLSGFKAEGGVLGVCGMILSNFLKGYCMLFVGIYYNSLYEEILDYSD